MSADQTKKEEPIVQYVKDPTRRAECKAEGIAKLEYLLFQIEFEQNRLVIKSKGIYDRHAELKADFKTKEELWTKAPFGKARKDAQKVKDEALAILTDFEVNEVIKFKNDCQSVQNALTEHLSKLDAFKKFE